MVLGRSSTNRLSDLRFNNMEHLKSSCDISRKQKWEQAISRLTSIKAFDHAERVYDEAKLKMQEGDEEEAYQLFTRMGIISKIIIHKNDFQDFKNSPNGRRFYYLFDQCIMYLKELEESLNKRYELKEVEKSYGKIDSRIAHEETTNDSDIIEGSLAIDPRDLVRYVASKHQVLIIDYREDQTDVVQYVNSGQLMVAQVPADAVVPGCIGSSLIRSAEIGQRVLLQRMADVDMVVLMGNEEVPTSEKDMIIGSKEQILYSALSTYNNNFRLKRPPLFLKGGFESWRLYYPMHTSTKTAMRKKFVNITSRTEFAKAVAEYKKDVGIQSLEYPQLLPAVHPKFKGLLMAHASVSDSAVLHLVHSSSDSPMTVGVISTDLSSESSNTSLTVELTPKDKFSNVDSGALNVLVEPATLNETKISDSTVTPIFTADINVEQGPDSQCVGAEFPPHEPPAVDRSNKPVSKLPSHGGKSSLFESFPGKPTLTVGGAKLYNTSALPETSPVPVVPDRYLKPQLVSSGSTQQLLHLYDSMMNILSASAVARSCHPGYTGLYNLGNTCFMNATLQALFNTSILREIFTKNKFINYINRTNTMGTFGVISSAFSALMDAVWSGLFVTLRPQQFLETFAAEVNASLADGQQHDAQEFQIYLLDALHEDTNRVVKRVPFEQNYTGSDLKAEAADFNEKLRKFGSSPVNDIFSCQTASSLQCNACKKQSVTFEEVTQLSIEVPNRNSTIEECIWNHFRDVELDDSCKWRCSDCKTLQTAVRKTFLWKLPHILIIHMKRFTFVEDRWEKNDVHVKFNTLPLELQKEYFSLYAVVNHRGSLNSGHYTTIVRNEITKQWLLFDDDVVAPVGIDSVCSKYAFILYYKRDSPQKRI